jgi:hypothetical protein
MFSLGSAGSTFTGVMAFASSVRFCPRTRSTAGQVTEQMETISYLDCLWRSARCSFGIQTGAITANDFRAGMQVQPSGEAIGGALRY